MNKTKHNLILYSLVWFLISTIALTLLFNTFPSFSSFIGSYIIIVLIPSSLLLWQHYDNIKSHLNQTLHQKLIKDFQGKDISYNFFPYAHQIAIIPPDHTFFDTFELQYNNNKTIYGRYQWETKTGRRKITHNRTFVMQLHQKNFDIITILPNKHLSWFDRIKGNDVQLESNEFTKLFTIRTGIDRSVVFHILNPRLMQLLLDEYHKHNFFALEINANYIFLSYGTNHTEISRPGIFQTKISNNQYKLIKHLVKHKIKIASNIINTLNREKAIK